MKSKDKIELHAKSIKEIKEMILEEKRELFAKQIERSQNKLKNTSELTNVRKRIAVLLSILKQKELVKNG